MSAHMRKRPTRASVILRDTKGRVYAMPNTVAKQYELSDEDSETISTEEFFAPYEKKYGKPGLLLRGIRVHEGLTQQEFADKIGLTQANLSNMENGRRPIGKNLAKRIADVFNVDYRLLL